MGSNLITGHTIKQLLYAVLMLQIRLDELAPLESIIIRLIEP